MYLLKTKTGKRKSFISIGQQVETIKEQLKKEQEVIRINAEIAAKAVAHDAALKAAQLKANYGNMKRSASPSHKKVKNVKFHLEKVKNHAEKITLHNKHKKKESQVPHNIHTHSGTVSADDGDITDSTDTGKSHDNLKEHDQTAHVGHHTKHNESDTQPQHKHPQTKDEEKKDTVEKRDDPKKSDTLTTISDKNMKKKEHIEKRT